MEKEKIKIICKYCKKEFFVSPCYKNRSFCSQECYHALNRGENWTGAVRKGKGSRPNEPRSAIMARARGKVLKHYHQLEEVIDIEYLKKVLNLGYCKSYERLASLILRQKRGKLFKTMLRYLHEFYEDIIEATPKYCYQIRNALPEDIIFFKEFLEKIKNYRDFKIKFEKLKKENKKFSIRNISLQNLQPFIVNNNIKTKIFDKHYDFKSKTIPEIKIRNFLVEAKIPFEEQVKIKKPDEYGKNFYYKIADFVLDKRLILEVNGNYWHGDPKVCKDPKRCKIYQEKDRLKYDFYNFLEIPFFVIWESEISDNFEKVKEKILMEAFNARNAKEFI